MSRSGKAQGAIRPARFVKNGDDGGLFLECTTGDRPLGISFRDTRRSDYVDATAAPGVHANAGEPMSFYAIDVSGAKKAMIKWKMDLQISGTVADGDRLGPTTNGLGITKTADQDYYGATAQADGTDGQFIPVVVDIGQRSST